MFSQNFVEIETVVAEEVDGTPIMTSKSHEDIHRYLSDA